VIGPSRNSFSVRSIWRWEANSCVSSARVSWTQPPPGIEGKRVRAFWFHEVGIRWVEPTVERQKNCPVQWKISLYFSEPRFNSIHLKPRNIFGMFTHMFIHIQTLIFILLSAWSHLFPSPVLFFWYWGLNSGPTPWATLPALFCVGFFGDRVLWTTCLGWLRTATLLSS
jgi:hypothetical protein